MPVRQTLHPRRDQETPIGPPMTRTQKSRPSGGFFASTEESQFEAAEAAGAASEAAAAGAEASAAGAAGAAAGASSFLPQAARAAAAIRAAIRSDLFMLVSSIWEVGQLPVKVGLRDNAQNSQRQYIETHLRRA
jgi:hypothetical protein